MLLEYVICRHKDTMTVLQEKILNIEIEHGKISR